MSKVDSILTVEHPDGRVEITIVIGMARITINTAIGLTAKSLAQSLRKAANEIES